MLLLPPPAPPGFDVVEWSIATVDSLSVEEREELERDGSFDWCDAGERATACRAISTQLLVDVAEGTATDADLSGMLAQHLSLRGEALSLFARLVADPAFAELEPERARLARGLAARALDRFAGLALRRCGE